MKKIVLLIFLLFLFSSKSSFAVTDPLAVPNNKFGIHIIDENDLESAVSLVNSSGGEWGYVTMVITEKDRNTQKWSNIFERLKKMHIIPVIRLATSTSSDFWLKPDPDEINKWLDFLDSLPWPVKNRYIIIYNEPNHAKEWGGEIQPENYVELLTSFSSYLKNSSSDYFILPAGLDASAPNSRETMDESQFLKRMQMAKPDWINYIDGWTSHSYPNPRFSGRVSDRGRGTLTSFMWEAGILKSMGFSRDLPVFITETGWQHNPESQNLGYLSPDAVAQNIVEAVDQIWSDKNIVMVSPFLLNYQAYPFSNFSWQKPNSKEFFPQFDAYRSLAKIKGEPVVNLPTLTPTLSPAPEVATVRKAVKGESISINDKNNENFLSSIFSLIRKFFTS